ncbi:hypothetical protein BWI17_06320 [Betaproteobacteria bacterium GR16-43]|nr:hypothetical protein BWI17_06320 [Betaproteobacteria bacterium GR16-43]
MAAPTTLVQFWTEEAVRLGNALSQAGTTLNAAGAAESLASDRFTAAGKALAAERDKVEAKRKALAGIPTYADGNPLLAEMRTAVMAMRAAAAESVAADADLRAKRAKRQEASAKVADLTPRLAEAKKARDAAKLASDKRQALVDKATTAPLKDLPADATALIAGDGAAAKAAVEGEFPKNAAPAKDFLARVRARRQLGAATATTAATVATKAIDVNKTWDEKTTRAAAKTAALQRAFDAAVEDLRAFTAAPSRFDAANAVLKSLVAQARPSLTPAQKDELLSPADAARVTNRENALAKLKDRDDAQVVALATRAAYDQALLDAQAAADPDKTEAELWAADAALKAKFDLIAAKDALVAAADAQVAMPVLQSWFAAVPDALWDQLEALDGASADLAAIAATVPANLQANLVNREKALAENLDAVSRERRLEDLLRAGLTQRTAGLAEQLDLDARRRQAAARFVAEV